MVIARLVALKFLNASKGFKPLVGLGVFFTPQIKFPALPSVFHGEP